MIKDIIKNKGEEISVLAPNDKLEYLIDLAKLIFLELMVLISSFFYFFSTF